MLLLPPISCVPPAQVLPAPSCAAQAFPTKPDLHPTANADGTVSLTVADTVALAVYIERTSEAEDSLKGCPLIRWTPFSAVIPKDKVLRIPVSEDDLRPTKSAYGQLGVAPLVISASCGYENAYYAPEMDVILLCQEVLDEESPGVARFILAHELAHAAAHRIGIDLGEAGADELATLVELSVSSNDVSEAANWFMDRSEPGGGPGDEHPSNLRRAEMLLCLDDGYGTAASPGCVVYERRAVAIWTELLKQIKD